MPLNFLNPGEERIIKKISGKEETRHFLENLGFVPGCAVVLISKIAENVIVLVKESRIALSREMASKIFV